MSGLDVLGGISAVIGLLDASIKIYDSAQHDIKLSATFEVIRLRLPVLLHTLEICKSHLGSRQDAIPEEICEALENTLENCDAKASNLRAIFERIIPGESDRWNVRYSKILRRLGKGNKVEELMTSITEDVQLVVNHDAVHSANARENLELENIIQEMKSIKSSVSTEDSSSMTFSSGGGAQTNNVNNGSGQQINNNGHVETQNFNSVAYKHKEDYSFYGPIGLQLGQAPHIDPELFIGRSSELHKIASILQPLHTSRKQRRLFLAGPGGIGKTQLAIAFAESHRDTYKSVLWLNATSEATLKDSFRRIASLIFSVQDPQVLESVTIGERVQRWLSDSQNTQWLLIFDNYDNPSHFRINDYFPTASHGAIVVTTRRLDVGSDTLQLKPLQDISDGLVILQSRSKRINAQSDPFAKRLAERLNGFPLALASAGVYVQLTGLSFERYLQDYEAHLNIDPDRSISPQEYHDRTLYTTWDISYFYLKVEDATAAKLLKMLAYFDNQSLWYELFHDGITENSPEWLCRVVASDAIFRRVMTTLTKYSFLEIDGASGSWSMHNCIHDWTLATLNKDLDMTNYWYVLDCVAACITKVDSASLGYTSFAPISRHAVRLLDKRFLGKDMVSNSSLDRLNKASHVSMLLRDQIQLDKAEQMLMRALAGKEKALGPDHTSTLATVNNLGDLFCDQGKLDKAEQMLMRALAGMEKALGPDHSSTLSTVHSLGVLFCDQGKLDKAEQMLMRALAGKEKALGPDHSSILSTVYSLGNLFRNLGKLDKAEQMYMRALAGTEKALGPDHSLTLSTVHALGILFCDQGKLDKAEQMFMRALAGMEKALGPDHSSTLSTVHALGNLFYKQGKLDKAEQIYMRALAGREKALGPDHSSILSTVHSLGNLFRNLGKLDKAEQMYMRALAGTEKALGPDHSLTLSTVHALGILFCDQGKLDKAEQMFMRALAGMEKALGPDHSSTLSTVHALGILFCDQGKLDKAEQMFMRALAGMEKALGPDHSSILSTVHSLGNLFRNLGKLDKAEQMYMRALAGTEKALGPDHSSTLITVNNLGILFYDQGKLDKAEQMFMRALAGMEKALGPDHSSTLSTVHALGNLFYKQGKLDKAEQMLMRALAGREKALGPDHTSTQKTASDLRKVRHRLAKPSN
ncbi:TPR repeat protein [Penicillium odoratum]|uniref:TPR repeat protein n=1 Tax=Penicillium odoratum TaxID=1167516 RepID=UPI002548B504|nr:TPR repeat protein [Penicillium odoratum]KAJ5760217.1 TPR repeat protein [Penicillium odoratum]